MSPISRVEISEGEHGNGRASHGVHERVACFVNIAADRMKETLLTTKRQSLAIIYSSGQIHSETMGRRVILRREGHMLFEMCEMSLLQYNCATSRVSSHIGCDI